MANYFQISKRFCFYITFWKRKVPVYKPVWQTNISWPIHQSGTTRFKCWMWHFLFLSLTANFTTNSTRTSQLKHLLPLLTKQTVSFEAKRQIILFLISKNKVPCALSEITKNYFPGNWKNCAQSWSTTRRVSKALGFDTNKERFVLQGQHRLCCVQRRQTQT